MKNSQKDTISEYENSLESSLRAFEKQVRNEVAQIFHTHTVFVQFLDKQQSKERELFYDLKQKVDDYMKRFGSIKSQTVFLFDIDETLAAYWENTIRPAWEVIVQYIQKSYYNTECWLCSARDKTAVEKFASTNCFNNNYIFSSREISGDIDEQEANSLWLDTTGARNKYNAWKEISSKYNNIQFVLIDDLFENQKTLSDQGVVLLFDRNLMATKFDIMDHI